MRHRSHTGSLTGMANDHHPPVEEYLTTIFELAEDGVQVIQARVAERLGHSAPTVHEMIHRLKDEGYLNVDGRRISLTKKGRTLAEGVVRKHRLAERLLTDVIGLPWHKAHAEAGRWEHVISDDVEDRLRIILDDPSTCPHGNPIPGTQQSKVVVRPLSSANPGDTVRLVRVTESVEIDGVTLEYLDNAEFITGSIAEVRGRAPDGTLTLGVGTQVLALGPSISDHLYVSAV
jgi:DtxR family transcriptional regulator, Mn-dependent transcriptional regulator